jgi:hypothetical protein
VILGRFGVAFDDAYGLGLRDKHPFGAELRGPSTRCLRFAAAIARAPGKTRYRLVITLCRAAMTSTAEHHGVSGDSPRQLIAVLLRQAWPGAQTLTVNSNLVFVPETVRSRASRGP